MYLVLVKKKQMYLLTVVWE